MSAAGSVPFSRRRSASRSRFFCRSACCFFAAGSMASAADRLRQPCRAAPPFPRATAAPPCNGRDSAAFPTAPSLQTALAADGRMWRSSSLSSVPRTSTRYGCLGLRRKKISRMPPRYEKTDPCLSTCRACARRPASVPVCASARVPAPPPLPFSPASRWRKRAARAAWCAAPPPAPDATAKHAPDCVSSASQTPPARSRRDTPATSAMTSSRRRQGPRPPATEKPRRSACKKRFFCRVVRHRSARAPDASRYPRRAPPPDSPWDGGQTDRQNRVFSPSSTAFFKRFVFYSDKLLLFVFSVLCAPPSGASVTQYTHILAPE